MSDLTGKTIASTYRDLLQVDASSTNGGLDGTVRTIQDGQGTNSALQLSQSAVNINGTLELNGTAITKTAAEINAITDISTLTGIAAGDAGTIYGRTLTGSTGVTITNADGVAGNPTFALENTSVSAGAYGPLNTITVDAQGRITDVVVATTISANAFIGGTLSGSSLYVENNVSVSGTLDVAGAVSIAGNTHIDGTVTVSNNIVAESNITVSGTVSVGGKLTSDNIATSIVSATYLYGDGSNITGLEGAGTMTEVRADTGIFMTVNGVTTTDITGSGTIGLKTDQSFGTVSATSFVGPTITSINSAITSVNSVIAAVSALTSVNSAAITSINTVVDGLDFATSAELATLSATMATSINNRTTAITALSATMATSINNSNTNITTNANAITSINSKIAAVSGALATSIGNSNSAITALSATMATSINNSNTNITTNTNAITSINSKITAVSGALATSIGNSNSAITALSATLATSIANQATDARLDSVSATLATSIANHMPLAGGTFTGNVSFGNNSITAIEDITLDDQIISEGDTDTYLQFHAANEFRVVTGGTEMLEVNDSYVLLGSNTVGSVETASKTGAVTPDLNIYNSFVWTLTGNITLSNPTTEVAGMSGVFIFIQDGTGSRTVSLGTDWETAGATGLTLSTAANAVDIVPYYVQSSGNILLGAPQLAFS